jgi:3-oxoacyl-[acyl-carrier-protein] synthase-1
MTYFAPPRPIFVNDTVVISSVGFNAQTTAASMRAGISRPEPLDGFAQITEDDEENITGYPIQLLTHGFAGAGRYIQLMRRGFEEVVKKLQAKPDDTPTKIYLLMAVPETSRYMQTKEPEDAPDKNPFQFYNTGWDETVNTALTQSGLLEILSGYKVVPVAPSSSAKLLAQSAALLQQKPDSLVISGFVDSFTDHAALTWLNNMGRLKSPNNPIGLIPGEAVSFLFTSLQAQRGAVELVSVNQTQEKYPLYSDASNFETSADKTNNPPDGQALNQLLVGFSKQYPAPNGQEFWCMSNFTGEQWQAMEWGSALHHYQRSTQVEPNPDVWLPNISLGEVGICFWSIAVAWAQQAFKRQYAPLPVCAITTFCYLPERTLIVVKGAN